MTFMNLKVLNRGVTVTALLVITIAIVYGASVLKGMGGLVLIAYVAVILPFIAISIFSFFKNTKRNTVIGVVLIVILLGFSLKFLHQFGADFHILWLYLAPLIVAVLFHKKRTAMCIGINMYTIIITILFIVLLIEMG